MNALPYRIDYPALDPYIARIRTLIIELHACDDTADQRGKQAEARAEIAAFRRKGGRVGETALQFSAAPGWIYLRPAERAQLLAA